MSTALPVPLQVPSEAQLARRETLRQLVRSKTFIVGVLPVLAIFFGTRGDTLVFTHTEVDHLALPRSFVRQWAQTLPALNIGQRSYRFSMS